MYCKLDFCRFAVDRTRNLLHHAFWLFCWILMVWSVKIYCYYQCFGSVWVSIRIRIQLLKSIRIRVRIQIQVPSWPTFNKNFFFIHSFHHKLPFRISIKDSQGQSKECRPLQIVSKICKRRNFRFFSFLAANNSSPGSGFVFPIRIRIQEIQTNTDPDPGFQINTDPHGPGSETLATCTKSWPFFKYVQWCLGFHWYFLSSTKLSIFTFVSTLHLEQDERRYYLSVYISIWIIFSNILCSFITFWFRNFEAKFVWNNSKNYWMGTVKIFI